METIYLTYPNHLQKEQLPPTVMALGFFDGVHLGHQTVINTAKQKAENVGIECSVMTFYPHPKEVLGIYNEKEPLKYITPLEKKIEVIANLNVDRLYVVTFDLQLSKLTPQQFVDEFLIGLNVKHVVAGFDYTYGYMGKGTMETLPFHSRKQFQQTTVNKVENNQEKISSTRIRSLLIDGDVEQVKQLLGRYYEIEGEVVHGDKRGRQIGFPTANIQLTLPYLIPKTGVYAVSLTHNGKRYFGVCNIGYKPTFEQEQKEKSIEVHIFQFDGQIYGENVSVQFYSFIRNEKKFQSVEALVQQIERDKHEAEQFFLRHSYLEA